LLVSSPSAAAFSSPIYSSDFGTLICGLATSEGVVITGCVIAGIVGGGLTAISAFVVSDLALLRKRELEISAGDRAVEMEASGV
jgi:hypothetical protein